MPRIKFKKGSQTRFLFDVARCLNLNWLQLSKKIKVHLRCLSDWRREKYTLPDTAFSRLIKLAGEGIKVPSYKVLPDFWSIEKAARMGGQALAEKYGGPGTPEGRKRGGIHSQIQRRLHPESYQQCNLRKEIKKPRNSPELAELIGIILGDGGMNNDYQVIITLHKENDRKYARFVHQLIRRLFDIEPAVYTRRFSTRKMVREVVLTGINIVEFLLSKGLSKGNKVKHQVGVPQWIKERLDFSTYCLRGLIDTDGGVFYHRHSTQGYNFFNIGLGFSNRSKPLLKFVYNTLMALGFTPKIDSRYVSLYKEDEVFRYVEQVQFHNPYHTQRTKRFRSLKKEFLRRGVRAV